MCLMALLSIWFNLVQMASMAIATKLKPDGALPQPKAVPGCRVTQTHALPRSIAKHLYSCHEK